MEMLEQMIETRAWKALRGIEIESEKYRLCSDKGETVHHLLAGCKVLAGNEYVRRHNNALMMVFAVEWRKEAGLLEESVVWYKTAWKKGTVIEKPGKKLVWKFEYNMRKTTTARRSELTLEDIEEGNIWIVDMACPAEANIVEKRRENYKNTNSWHLKSARDGLA